VLYLLGYYLLDILKYLVTVNIGFGNIWYLFRNYYFIKILFIYLVYKLGLLIIREMYIYIGLEWIIMGYRGKSLGFM